MRSWSPNVSTLRAPAQPAPPARTRPRGEREVSPVHRRRRLVGLLAGLTAVVLVVVAGALLVTGSAPAPPATGAAAIVPADALAYLNVSLDPGRPAVTQARKLAARFSDFPLLSGAAIARLSAVLAGGRAVDFGREIRPWLGREASIALMDTPTAAAGSLIVLDVSMPARARAFLSGAGASAAGSYDGMPLLRYPTGTELAFVQHYLALGQDESVRAAIDVATGRSQSLLASPTYRRAAAGEPADRALDVYVSADGVRRLLVPRGGVLGAIGTLLDQPALVASTISVSPAPGGARVRVHSALDPRGGGAHPFAPTLQSLMPSGTTALLDAGGLERAAPRVLAAGAAAGVGGGVPALLGRLASALGAEGVDVGSLLSIFSGETAIGIGPTTAGRTPSLVLISRTRDDARAQSALAALEVPLEQLFPTPSSGPGQTPVLGDQAVDGVTVHQLALAPGLQIDFAVFDGLAVVSTGISGIAGVVHHAHALADSSAYQTTLGDRPASVTSLVFLDLSQLLRFGEQTGLMRGARYEAIRADLEKIRAVGLDSTSGESDSTANLFLEIS